MELEEKHSLVNRLSGILTRSCGVEQSVEILKAVFEVENDSDRDFAINHLQPILLVHLDSEPTDTETTSLLCELFAYCT